MDDKTMPKSALASRNERRSILGMLGTDYTADTL